MTFSNPVFDSEYIARAFSFPIQLPLSSRSLLLFNYPNRLDAVPNYATIAAKLWLSSQEYFKGTFDVYKAYNTMVDGNLQNDVRDTLDKAEKIKINTLLETFTMPVTTGKWVFALTFAGTFGGVYYQIVINGHSFGYTTVSGDTVSTAVINLTNQIHAVFPNITTSRTDALELHDPDGNNPIEYSALLNMSASEATTYGEARQNAFLDFIKTDLITPPDSHRWPRKFNGNLYDGKALTVVANPINYITWNGTDWIIRANEFRSSEDWSYTYQPFVRLAHVIEKVRVALGLDAITGDFDEWADVDNIEFDHDVTFDFTRKEKVYDSLSAAWVDKYMNVFANTINLNNLVPDISAKELFKNICEWLRLDMTIEDNRLIFRKNKRVLKGDVRDFSLKINPTHEKDVKKPQGFTLKYKSYDGDTMAPLTDYVSGDGVTIVDVPVSVPNQKVWVYGKMIESNRKASTTVPFRVFFDRGLNGDYLMSSNDCFEEDGTTLRGLWSMQFDGSHGIVETFRGGIDELVIDGESVTKTVYLTTADLFDLDNWNNSRVYFYDDEGASCQAVIKKIEVKVMQWNLAVARVTFVKI